MRNCLKKKSDEKEKVNQACENHEQVFVAALSANDHTTYDWIVDSGATQHMTFMLEVLFVSNSNVDESVKHSSKG